MDKMKKISDDELENVSGGGYIETFNMVNSFGLSLSPENIGIVEKALLEEYGITANLSLTKQNTYFYEGRQINRDRLKYILMKQGKYID